MTCFSTDVACRLLSQYRESSLLISFITELLKESDEICDAIKHIQDNRYLDGQPRGVQLDILGVIIGQPRVVVLTSSLGYFGLEPDVGSLGFGELNNPATGGRFRGVDEDVWDRRFLTDDEYVTLLYAKVYKNTTDCTPNAIISMCEFLFDAPIRFTDGNTYYMVEVGRPLTDIEKYLFVDNDMLPRTIGVGVDIGEFVPYPNPADSYFGFSDDPIAKGLIADGDDPAVVVGGVLSK